MTAQRFEGLPRVGTIARPTAAAVVLALAACHGSPTGPNDPPAAPAYQVEINLSTVVSPAICEDAFTGLDGGEFVWRFVVTWPDGTSDVLDQTPSFPSLKNFVTLQQNVPYDVHQLVTHTVHAAPGAKFSLSAEVSEVDFDLFGNNPAPDSRMNDAKFTATYTWQDPVNGWTTGRHTAAIETTPDCRFNGDYYVSVDSL